MTDVRLPRHLIPLKYKLELVPFLIPNNFTIRGFVRLTLRCVSSASNVTVHAADMVIHNDTVAVSEVNTGSKLIIKRHEYDGQREFYVIHLDAALRPETVYNVDIWFTAKLDDGLKGFYRSVYKNEKGQDV
jgi:hypothetical protein